MNRTIWITWENQIRNTSMASLLGARLFVISYNGNRLFRYIYCTVKTFRILLNEKPRFVFAQNPSIILNYFLLFFKMIFGFKLISDAHYVGIIASNGSFYYQKILNLCNRLVDMVIVTNKEHYNFVKTIGGKAVICEDPLPEIDKYKTDESCCDKMVYYICSFDVDEPYEIAFKAANLLIEDDFRIYVTGNYKRVNIDPHKYQNVTFLGYIPVEKYYNNLYKSNVVLDLTENENCLVCGAYEAMVAEKPLVTSDTLSLRNFFTKGTVFTTHDDASIAKAIRCAYQNRFILGSEIRQWKKQIKYRQEQNKLKILTNLGITSQNNNEVF